MQGYRKKKKVHAKKRSNFVGGWWLVSTAIVMTHLHPRVCPDSGPEHPEAVFGLTHGSSGSFDSASRRPHPLHVDSHDERDPIATHGEGSARSEK